MSVSVAPSPIAINTRAKLRIESIDLIRGVVMILMAIDHVRVFSGVPAVAHRRCLFHPLDHALLRSGLHLSGRHQHLLVRTQAHRYVTVPAHPRRLAHLPELTLLRLAWTFNLDFRHYEMAGVIWVIGCCMILMAGLVKLPLNLVAALGWLSSAPIT